MSKEAVGEPVQDNRTTKTVAGLLLAPVAGGFGSPIVFAFVGSLIDFSNPGFDWGAFASLRALGPVTFYFLIYAALLGIPMSLVIGTPAYLALRKLGLNGFIVYLFVGAAIGFIGAMSVGALSGWGIGLFLVPWLSVLISCGGGIGGLTFWLIRRPDRDAVSPSPTP